MKFLKWLFPFTTSVKERQPYVYRPVYLDPKQPSLLETLIASMFGRDPILPQLIVDYRLVFIRWLKGSS